MQGSTLYVVLALGLLFATGVHALDATVDALGSTQKLSVELGFVIGGVESNPAPCTNTSANCVPQLQVAENPAQSDVLIVRYAFNTTFMPGVSENISGIDLRACFAPVSQTDRGWRKDKYAINPAKSNQCKMLLNKKGALAPQDGVFRWSLPNSLPPEATYNIRAFTICGYDGDTPTYCSWGQSRGYFASVGWNSVPSWLIAVTVPLICVGPAILVMYGSGHYIKKFVHRRK